MKKIILTLAALALLPLASAGGEISPGSVPGTINYQGRLERDNAPITGPIHIYFRIYNSATASNTGGAACGAVFQPCLWASPEITVQATQGIFSVDLAPSLTVLAGGQQLYLEVQVESDTLSPREPLNSVAYALVAKRLEDGADVTVSTLVAHYAVNLATASNAYLTVGTGSQFGSARVTVNGGIKLTAGGIEFADGSSMNVASIASAGNVSNSFDATVQADADSNGTGDVIFKRPLVELARITNAGNMGIGTAAPGGKLDVAGSLYVGNEGIYDRDDGEVNIKEDLVVEGGRVTGSNSDEYISIGETNNIISFHSDGGERMRVHSDGKIGVGLTAPTANLHVAGDILSNAGLRGGNVSVGTYAGSWSGLANEVRAADNTHLLLQQTNSYNVGIGTNTPREKLHVRGSVRSDYGVIAATAAFSGDVSVDGNFDANSGLGNMVYLSSTVVYGDLTVTGRVGSEYGFPAYIASTQTFTGQNTFLNQVAVSSDIYVSNRLGVGVYGFDFQGARYLQVGDNLPAFANDEARAYLVAGSNANAVLNFYRGATPAATLNTQGGANLGLVIGGSTKTLTDATYHRIQNSVVWISTGYNTTPSIYISSSLGNVGVGTSIMEPNWKLTVAGNIRLNGSGSSLIFADGTYLDSAGSIGSATNVSANGDAVVQSNADLSGGGDVILRSGSLDGLILNTGGNVGIGTLSPVSRLNVRGGDVVLGTPYNPYASDSVEDLLVGGNIVFDGALIQRSAQPVELSGLIVSGDVYLSTAASANTGVGTASPGAKLDVEGDAQFGAGASKSYFSTGGALTLATQLTVPNGGTGATSLTNGGILYGGGTGAIAAMPVLANGQLLIGDNSGAPAAANITQTSSSQVIVTNGAGSIALSLPQPVDTTADPVFNSLTLATGLTLATDLTVPNGGTGAGTFTTNGVLYGNATSPLQATAAGSQYQVLRAGAGGTPAFGQIALNQSAAVTGNLPTSNGGTGADLSAGTTGDIPYFSGAGTIGFINNGTANYLLQANGAAAPSWVQSTNSSIASTIVRRDALGDFSAHDVTVNKLVASDIQGSVSGGSTYIYNHMTPGDDFFIVRGVLPTDNDGYLELATANNGNEPIYVRQYDNTSWTPFAEAYTRSATLLDGSGNTLFPGTVSASAFSGPVSCTNCITLSAAGSEVTGTLPIANGGTGATDASTARGNLGLGTIATQASNSVSITGGSISGITDLSVADGGTGASDAGTARGNLGLGSIATQASNSVSITGGSISGITDLAVADGGTGASDAGTARTNLGLGSLATLSSINNGNWSGADLALTNGGTGASDAGTARGNLGLGSIATQDSNSVSITGGSISGITDLAIADGGTGAGSYTGSRVVMTNAGGTAFVSASGGVSGTYYVARTTETTGSPCNAWTFSNGVVTAIGANIACP